MTQDELKQAVAKAAIEYVVPNSIVGVGTGSTANFFIDELAKIKESIKGAVASSEATAARLRSHGISVFDLNEITSMPVYIDGADEIDATGAMIKGGGGALTREKIVASVAARFICIADGSKQVETLGNFPLPIEVIPMAQASITRFLEQLGGRVSLRTKEGSPFVTDNGNYILDWHDMRFADARAIEQQLNQYPGVVTVGLFALNGASICLLGTSDGVKTLNF